MKRSNPMDVHSSIVNEVIEGNLINFVLVVLILIFTLRIKPRA